MTYDKKIPDVRPNHLPKVDETPRNGEEILRKVERLKREPIRIEILGMKLSTLILVLAIAWLL